MRLTPPLRSLLPSSRAVPLTLASPSPLIRAAVAEPSTSTPDSADFALYPDFFSPSESAQVLCMALWKLDKLDGVRRRWRRRNRGVLREGREGEEGLQRLFAGEYGFEEGHFDSVIHHYRETLISSFPPVSEAEAGTRSWPDLAQLMAGIYSLLPHPAGSPSASASASDTAAVTAPPPHTSTHALHLAPHGAILPHVDNLEASGSVIVGVSLGAERTLRLRDKGGGEGWDVRLPSGSVYVQRYVVDVQDVGANVEKGSNLMGRDSIRYKYEHSILPYEDAGSVWDGERLEFGHRLSLMVRDAPADAAR